jgi:hypothetical protein
LFRLQPTHRASDVEKRGPLLCFEPPEGVLVCSVGSRKWRGWITLQDEELVGRRSRLCSPLFNLVPALVIRHNRFSHRPRPA